MIPRHAARDATTKVVRVVRRVLSTPDDAGVRRLLAPEGAQLPVREAMRRGIPEDALEPVNFPVAGHSRQVGESDPTVGDDPKLPDTRPYEPNDLRRAAVDGRIAAVAATVKGVGDATAAAIARAITVDDVRHLGIDGLAETLTAIKGVGESTALAVIEALHDELDAEG